MGRELICKRLLSGEQAAPKERMRPRKSPARSKRLLIDVTTEVFSKDVTAVLLPRGHDQRCVAIVGIDEARKPVSHAGNRVQIYKAGPSAGHCVSQPHAYGCAFV